MYQLPVAKLHLIFYCGPDEDGCFPGSEQYCSCVPYNQVEANKPYCFNFDELTCIPLSQVSHCESGFTFPNQGSCLAVIFQSEADPPCKLSTLDFCIQHHSAICDANGQPQSCQ